MSQQSQATTKKHVETKQHAVTAGTARTAREGGNVEAARAHTSTLKTCAESAHVCSHFALLAKGCGLIETRLHLEMHAAISGVESTVQR
jgi:hypothetical protein